MLEASTRARTGDSAETIKLFENNVFQMNRTHNTTGVVNLKQIPSHYFETTERYE